MERISTALLGWSLDGDKAWHRLKATFVSCSRLMATSSLWNEVLKSAHYSWTSDVASMKKLEHISLACAEKRDHNSQIFWWTQQPSLSKELVWTAWKNWSRKNVFILSRACYVTAFLKIVLTFAKVKELHLLEDNLLTKESKKRNKERKKAQHLAGFKPRPHYQ